MFCAISHIVLVSYQGSFNRKYSIYEDNQKLDIKFIIKCTNINNKDSLEF